MSLKLDHAWLHTSSGTSSTRVKGQGLLTCIQCKAAHEVNDADIEDSLDGNVHVLRGGQGKIPAGT